MTSKTCFRCLCHKPLLEFYAHSGMADGRLNKCKDCTKKDVAMHRQANLERVRQYDKMRASQPHRVALRVKVADEWNKSNPLGYRAHYQVRNALRDGKLKKLPCFVCGKSNAEAHHPSYNLPLDVVWLCSPHHKQAHAQTPKA